MSVSEADVWIDAGEAASVAEGEARGVDLRGHRICVVHYDGAFHAIADLCTHGQAYLSEGFCDTAEGVMECPLHGGLFDFRTGAAVGTPVTLDVAAYPIKVVDGRIFVQLGLDAP